MFAGACNSKILAEIFLAYEKVGVRVVLTDAVAGGTRVRVKDGSAKRVHDLVR